MLNHFSKIRQTAAEDLSQLLLSYWGSHQDSSTPRGSLFNLQGGTKAKQSFPSPIVEVTRAEEIPIFQEQGK